MTMQHQYRARYTASNGASVATLTLDAATDAAAVDEVREIVRAGYRNEAQCQVDLQDGRIYGAVNKHGAYMAMP